MINLRAPSFPALFVCTGEEWRALLREDTPKNPCIECKPDFESRYDSPECQPNNIVACYKEPEE